MKRTQAKESDIQRTVKEFLELHGWLVWRNNSGKVKAAGGSWMQLAKKGSPDLYALRSERHDYAEGHPLWLYIPRLVGIEVKKPGEDQSEDQIAFQRDFEEHGGKYLVARDLKDVAHLK